MRQIISLVLQTCLICVSFPLFVPLAIFWALLSLKPFTISQSCVNYADFEVITSILQTLIWLLHVHSSAKKCFVIDGADTLGFAIVSSLSLARNCEQDPVFLFLVFVAWLSVRLAPCWPALNCRRAIFADVHILLADFGICYRLLTSTTWAPLFVRLELVEIINCQLTYVIRALPFLFQPSPAQLQALTLEQSPASRSSIARSTSIIAELRSCANSLEVFSNTILSETLIRQSQLWFPYISFWLIHFHVWALLFIDCKL